MCRYHGTEFTLTKVTRSSSVSTTSVIARYSRTFLQMRMILRTSDSSNERSRAEVPCKIPVIHGPGDKNNYNSHISNVIITILPAYSELEHLTATTPYSMGSIYMQHVYFLVSVLVSWTCSFVVYGTICVIAALYCKSWHLKFTKVLIWSRSQLQTSKSLKCFGKSEMQNGTKSSGFPASLQILIIPDSASSVYH